MRHGHHFQGQKVKGQLAGGGGILWRPPAQLVFMLRRGSGWDASGHKISLTSISVLSNTCITNTRTATKTGADLWYACHADRAFVIFFSHTCARGRIKHCDLWHRYVASAFIVGDMRSALYCRVCIAVHERVFYLCRGGVTDYIIIIIIICNAHNVNR